MIENLRQAFWRCKVLESVTAHNYIYDWYSDWYDSRNHHRNGNEP